MIQAAMRGRMIVERAMKMTMANPVPRRRSEREVVEAGMTTIAFNRMRRRTRRRRRRGRARRKRLRRRRRRRRRFQSPLIPSRVSNIALTNCISSCTLLFIMPVRIRKRSSEKTLRSWSWRLWLVTIMDPQEICWEMYRMQSPPKYCRIRREVSTCRTRARLGDTLRSSSARRRLLRTPRWWSRPPSFGGRLLKLPRKKKPL
mmetsp:Transcript_9057/g.25507  ORF Transcript_9057/g.25507 Transcript_9057/m.25507 type:complete len:202 (+) Transcript_9057:3067-3672(+)